MTEILVLARSEVEDLVSMSEAIAAMENVFARLAEGRAVVPGVIHFMADENQGGWGVKPGYLVDDELVSVKVGCGYYNNRTKELPTNIAAILLSDARTGTPIAFMDGIHVTALRTGATGGVAAKYLARDNSTRVGVLGTGTQGRMQVLALDTLFSLTEVRAYGIHPASLDQYVREMKTHVNSSILPVESPERVVRGVDIVVTATPSKTPFVKNSWVEEGVHINSIGADMKGKREIETGVYERAKIVTDKIEVAKEKELFDTDKVIAELGEVIAGKKKGRTSYSDITLFDSTGIGIQDTAIAKIVYEKAKQRGIGRWTSI